MQPTDDLTPLAAANINHYEREADVLQNGKPVDFAWPTQRIIVECWAHQDKPSFGEMRARYEKQQDKICELDRAGWRVYIVNARRDRSTEAVQLVAWLRENLVEA